MHPVAQNRPVRFYGDETMKKKLKLPALFLILAGLTTSCATSKSALNGAPSKSDPLSSMIEFYRGPLNHLSAVRYGECPMYPSDSEYSLKSVQKHGMLKGWIMAMDRLMRCGRDETRLSPKIFIDGKWKIYDPVEKNDFWRHDD